jgi:hypothetical protein
MTPSSVVPGVLRRASKEHGPTTSAGGPLLRGWLHVGAFAAWLIGGPFLIAAGPDAAAGRR